MAEHQTSTAGYAVYGRFRYQIDRDRSHLRALIETDRNGWSLTVATVNDQRYSDDIEAPQCEPSMHTSFLVENLRDWRELSGRHISIDYSDLLNDPILPGQSAGLYLGYHLFPHRHEIEFGSRRGSSFPFKWHIEASESDNERLVQLNVEGTVCFSHVVVSFPNILERIKRQFGGRLTSEQFQSALDTWEPDVAEARRLIGRQFRVEDFGPPSRQMWCLEFPLTAID